MKKRSLKEALDAHRNGDWLTDDECEQISADMATLADIGSRYGDLFHTQTAYAVNVGTLLRSFLRAREERKKAS